MNSISPQIILLIIGLYFLMLIAVAFVTSKKGDNESFFLAGRKSPWFLVAFGMIGASLSGVTFISIPGVVGKSGTNENFAYMQLVFGYLLGYIVIANVLMPLYYRLKLTSIYEYMLKRFGFYSYKTSAFYFLISKVIGSAFRLFLVAIVLQKFLMEPMGLSFPVTLAITIILIWVYTFRGGIKTIVVTDTIQTTALITAVVLTIIYIGKDMGMGITDMIDTLKHSKYSKIFYFENGWSNPNYFFKQFFSGALIAIVMTGMDQDMMQKNLSCKTIGEAKKNMYSFSVILVFVNLLFLSLGALLYIFAQNKGMELPEKSDLLYPTIALQYLPPVVGVVFIIGIIAAAYSSADSALTGLTTSFCIDFLNCNKTDKTEKVKKKQRMMVHIGFSVLLFFVIIIFNILNNDAVINGLFKAAGYTYGPILGLFTFGLTNTRKVNDKWVILVAIAAPILSYIIDVNSKEWLNGFTFGFFILALNGLLTYLGLLLISRKERIRD